MELNEVLQDVRGWGESIKDSAVEMFDAWRYAAPAQPHRKPELQVNAVYHLADLPVILGHGFSVRSIRRKILARQFPRGRRSGTDIIFMGKVLIAFFSNAEEEE